MLSDYPLLHQEMRKAGFSTTIMANNNIEYHLPSAEYFISTTSSFDEVLKAAKKCADTTRRTSTVLVVEFSGWKSDGMIPVRK
jgi:hypothetical protein